MNDQTWYKHTGSERYSTASIFPSILCKLDWIKLFKSVP